RRAARGASGPPRGRGDRRRPARGAGARPGARGGDPGGERDATRPRGERPALALRCRAAGLPVRGPGVRRAPDALPGRCRARLPVVVPLSLDIPREVLGIVPQVLVTKHHLIPTGLVRSTLTLAMADPSNLTAINEVKFLTGYDVKVAVAAPTVIQHAIERYYDRDTDYDAVLSQIGNDSLELLHDEAEIDLKELERATEEAPVVRLVNALLSDAIRKRASDVHVEPYEKMLRVRFRIDGVLYEIMQPPLRLKNALTSRIKVMAQLDIAERRLPQD